MCICHLKRITNINKQLLHKWFLKRTEQWNNYYYFQSVNDAYYKLLPFCFTKCFFRDWPILWISSAYVLCILLYSYAFTCFLAFIRQLMVDRETRKRGEGYDSQQSSPSWIDKFFVSLNSRTNGTPTSDLNHMSEVWFFNTDHPDRTNKSLLI